jgi:lysophospholipase L1-like esterase
VTSGLKNVALVIVATVASVLLAEGIGQLFVEPPPPQMSGFRLGSSRYYMEDEELGWIPRPNVRGSHDQAGSFRSQFSTNSRGLRGAEIEDRSWERHMRIVVLGDSFAWGYGVDDEDTFASVIERLLPSMRVANLGVTAYGIRQETAYFERIGRGMKPEIVLLALTMNDITDPARRLPGETVKAWRTRIGFGPSTGEEREARRPHGLKPWLADHSVLYRSLIGVVNTNRTLVSLLESLGVKGPRAGIDGLDTNLRPFLESYPDSVAEEVELTRRELLELRDSVEYAGSRLLVAVVPAMQSVDARARRNSIAYTQYFEDDFDLDKPYRWLGDFGESSGIAVLNTVGAFRNAHEGGARPYLSNDSHFNAAGHRLFAELIVRFLVDHHWTQVDGPGSAVSTPVSGR